MKKYLMILCVMCCISSSCTNQTHYKETDGRKVRKINEANRGFFFN